MNLWPWFILVTAYGACVGSFLNVVIYRLPEGKSIVTPPSACPKCGHGLAWYDNVPVLGWLWLRGKCRYCGTPISLQYPLIEALCAALFAWLFIDYYVWPFNPQMLGMVPGAGVTMSPDIYDLGLKVTWPIFIVHLILVASLLAATVVDAKLYLIPLEIPWTATAVAILVLPVAAWFQLSTTQAAQVLPWPSDRGVWSAGRGLWLAIGGLGGLGFSVFLLTLRVLPRSFDEDPAAHDEAAPGAETPTSPPIPAPDQPAAAVPMDPSVASAVPPQEITVVSTETPPIPVPAASAAHENQADLPNPEDFLAYPHARREVLKECLFLLPPVLGAMLGWWVGRSASLPATGHWAAAAGVLGGVILGYLVGGAVVWATRIFGTLAFGKEAMGLGDVHLLAAVGAVLGARLTVLTFFVAPFFGLTFIVVAVGLKAVFKGKTRIIPYGPSLAAAAFVMMLVGEALLRFLGFP